MTVIRIGIAHDARLDEYRSLPDADLAIRGGIFVAEGRLVVRRLLTESPLATRSVMVTEAAHAALADVLAARPDVRVYVVPQDVVNGVTGVNIHRGCLAIGVRPAAAHWTEVVGAPHGAPVNVVVLERVANADNVGVVFRNAAAFGAAAVLLDDVSTDPLYRKAIRTSMGAALRVPFARMEPWPAALQDLKRRGFVLLALTPAAAARPLRECVARVAHRPVALLLGHEGEGLTDAALDACDLRARIPMAPGVDSVNVASASAVALYELKR
ncbi:MAG: RNA methyltransferase [Acidimicrobiia bacterium]|nr:RNA methyltransferase [Acidimicrobiia bacterium]